MLIGADAPLAVSTPPQRAAGSAPSVRLFQKSLEVSQKSLETPSSAVSSYSSISQRRRADTHTHTHGADTHTSRGPGHLSRPHSVISLLGEGKGVIGESRTPIGSLWGVTPPCQRSIETELSFCEFNSPNLVRMCVSLHRVLVHLSHTGRWGERCFLTSCRRSSATPTYTYSMIGTCKQRTNMCTNITHA